MGWETKQLGSLGAQLQNFADDAVVVVLVAVVAAIHKHAPGFFAQVAAI